MAVTLALGACTSEAAPASQPSSSPPTKADPDFPLTLVHSQGETVIDEVPARVVTTGMEQSDTVLALGVVPVATEVSFDYPWREEKLTELGATQPERLLSTERADDALTDLVQFSPDLIIAGGPEPFGNALLADGYLRLTEAAPSLYPTDQALDPKGYPSGVSWRETLTQTGAALGKSVEAAAVLSSIDEALAGYAAEHPEFAGKTIAVAGNSAGAFNVIEETAPMALVLKSLGFVPIDTSKIEHLDNKGIMSVAYLSPEQAAQIDVDVMLIPDKKAAISTPTPDSAPALPTQTESCSTAVQATRITRRETPSEYRQRFRSHGELMRS